MELFLVAAGIVLSVLFLWAQFRLFDIADSVKHANDLLHEIDTRLYWMQDSRAAELRRAHEAEGDLCARR